MVILAIFLLIGFSLQAFSVKRVFFLMGTYGVIEMPSDREVYEVYRTLREIEKKISDHLENSDISRINNNAGVKPVKVSTLTYRLLQEALLISELTDGRFDITIGSYTINHKRKKKIDEDRAKRLINYRELELREGLAFLRRRNMAVDTGGIGKGFALSEVRKSVQSPWGFISIGGDMTLWGHSRVLAVRTPFEPRPFIEGVNKGDLCLSTSGNYHKRHIKQKDQSLMQITVVHRDCTIADALATALFTMNREERRAILKKLPSLGILEVYRDHSFWMNRRFADYFEVLFLRSP